MKTLLAALFVLLTTLNAQAVEIPQSLRGYDRIYPYHGEICGLTQISKKPGFGLPVRGGVGGHGVLYLKGACRDLSAAYPRIALCDELPAPAPHQPGPTGGVGISVNSDFANVNWIAIEDREFFYYGDLKPGERLTRESYLRTRARAEKMEILRGVRFHAELFQKAPATMSQAEFMLEDTFGTDYAINLGRGMVCARIPLTREKMGRAVSYLNSLNERYVSGAREYEWSGPSDNCTHVAANALAAGGVYRTYGTSLPILAQIFNLAIPYNEFARLMRAGNALTDRDLLTVFRDSTLRVDLEGEGWLPTQPGTLGFQAPIWQDNDLYDLDIGILKLQFPGLNLIERRTRHYLADRRTTDLRANLEWFRDRYRAELGRKDRLSIAPGPDAEPYFDREAFERLAERYYEMLERRLGEIERNLRLLGE